MLKIRRSIRQLAFATLFIVLGALPSAAGVIQVSFSGGPAESIEGSNSVLLEVIGSADVVFDYTWNFGGNPGCTPIDSSQPYSCSGGLQALAQITGTPGNPLQTQNEFGGLVEDINGVYSSDLEPNDFCNGVSVGSGTTCALTLGPGTYELLASLYSPWGPTSNATALLPAESVTATLTINSGTVFVVPEPTTQRLVFLGGVFLLALTIGSRLYRALGDPEQ
jgi:hypothetical protein